MLLSFRVSACCALLLLQSCNNPSDAKAAIDSPFSSTSVVVVVLIRRVVIDPKSDQFDFLRGDQNFLFSLFCFFFSLVFSSLFSLASAFLFLWCVVLEVEF